MKLEKTAAADSSCVKSGSSNVIINTIFDFLKTVTFPQLVT